MEAWTAMLSFWTGAHGKAARLSIFLPAITGAMAGCARRQCAAAETGLQPGNMVQASWRARLSEHLGTATIDPGRAYAAEVLTDQVLLAGLSAMCALLKIVPERQAYPACLTR